MHFAIATLITAATAALAAPSPGGWDIQKEAARVGAVHIITVSDEGFSPASLEAKYGDILEFHFKPGTHSVVQSSYESPCSYVKGGFTSGNMDTPEDQQENVRDFQVSVSDDQPIWFYNGSLDRCHKEGHVGVVNPPASDSLGNFQKSAREQTSTENVARTLGGILN
ncbi:Extracellular serine-rich protein [Ceratocystis lukuohia]|uniref:Extracellular serine-rich protein n=1 Tax=Ceratocystis lukuohia TaxID=2019550 RepID=A0ABR4MKY1_9PEZI